MYVASWCCKSFCVVPCASFCTGHFVMAYLHCLQYSLFEHLFNLYCPCSRTENKFNVYLKIDSDNGLGVPPRTNKPNKARVKRSLFVKVSSEEFYQLRGTPRNFVNDRNNFLRGFPRKAFFLGVLRKVGNPRGVHSRFIPFWTIFWRSVDGIVESITVCELVAIVF